MKVLRDIAFRVNIVKALEENGITPGYNYFDEDYDTIDIDGGEYFLLKKLPPVRYESVSSLILKGVLS